MSDARGEDVIAALPLRIRTPGRARTIAAGEIALLTTVSGLVADDRPAGPANVDALLDADDGALDALLVPAVVLSLAADNPLFRGLEAHGITVVAALRHRCVLARPVVGGDTIATDSEIRSVRASASRSGHYVLTVRDVGVNQVGDEVAVIERVILMRHDMPSGEGAGR